MSARGERDIAVRAAEEARDRRRELEQRLVEALERIQGRAEEPEDEPDPYELGRQHGRWEAAEEILALALGRSVREAKPPGSA